MLVRTAFHNLLELFMLISYRERFVALFSRIFIVRVNRNYSSLFRKCFSYEKHLSKPL